MHEVSLVENIVALIEDEQRRQAFSRVRTVSVHVGLLGHVEPDALRFCFDAVTRGTAVDRHGRRRRAMPGLRPNRGAR